MRRIIISECRTWNLLLRRPMLFWSSFLFVHRHYWTSPVNHPQDIPTKELQSLYIFTMSVTHCDRGKGGAPPRPLPPSGPFASLRSSANFCMASLHIVLHFSLTSAIVLYVLPTAFTFSIISRQIVCFFWFVKVFEN